MFTGRKCNVIDDNAIVSAEIDETAECLNMEHDSPLKTEKNLIV